MTSHSRSQPSTERPWTISEVRTVEGEYMVVGGVGQEFGLIASCPDKDNAEFIVRLTERCEQYKGQVESGASEIEALKARIEALGWRVIALEQVISEEMYPENCSDDANRMLLESAIESHGRRIKARSALSPSPTKGE